MSKTAYNSNELRHGLELFFMDKHSKVDEERLNAHIQWLESLYVKRFEDALGQDEPSPVTHPDESGTDYLRRDARNIFRAELRQKIRQYFGQDNQGGKT